jgi:hypothetical protein
MPPMTDDPRRHSAAADRNRGPILEVLARVLPVTGLALEIASGTGQQVAHFAAGLPGWRWQPSDPDPGARASIAAWCAGLAKVLPPLDLDVMAPDWPGAPDRVDAVICANMIHISPWPTCEALMQGAAGRLSPTGLLLVYGPFLVDGEPTAAGNLAFDADLRARHPAWGLRRLGDVQSVAAAAGLVLRERLAMPANNLTLVFARQA